MRLNIPFFFLKYLVGDDRSDPSENNRLCDVDLECGAHLNIRLFILGS